VANLKLRVGSHFPAIGMQTGVNVHLLVLIKPAVQHQQICLMSAPILLPFCHEHRTERPLLFLLFNKRSGLAEYPKHVRQLDDTRQDFSHCQHSLTVNFNIHLEL
jgi:hypothetical protein